MHCIKSPCSGALVALATVLLSGNPAHCQPAATQAASTPAASTPAAATPVAVAPSPADPAAADTASLRLQLGLARKYMSQNKAAAAREVLTGVIAEAGPGAEAAEANRLLAELNKRHPSPDGLEADEGRGLLVMGNTAAWMSVGLFAPLLWIDDVDDYITQSYWSAVGFGLPAGLLSWYLTRDVVITRGYATMQTSAQLFGMLDGFLLAGLIQGQELSREFATGMALAGTAAGLGASILFKDDMQVSRARASFIFTSWMWGSLLGVYTGMTIWDSDLTMRQGIGSALLAGGGAMAAAVAWGPRWSSNRVGYVSLFGLGGYLISYALLIDRLDEDNLSLRTVGNTLLVTQAAGLLIGVLVTSGMKDDVAGSEQESEPLVAGSLLRLDGGRTRLAIPLPRLGFTHDGGQTTPHVAVDLLSGNW